ncbi:MAG: hypothetical protein HYZ28_10245 [Myxococcales bacterium]|nr:hypothetical protein [Myxococcales bacterium]
MSLLKLHFIVPGRLPGWTESALSRLHTERDLADYEAGFSVSADRYEEQRAEAEKLIQQLKQFLRATAGWRSEERGGGGMQNQGAAPAPTSGRRPVRSTLPRGEVDSSQGTCNRQRYDCECPQQSRDIATEFSE